VECTRSKLDILDTLSSVRLSQNSLEVDSLVYSAFVKQMQLMFSSPRLGKFWQQTDSEIFSEYINKLSSFSKGRFQVCHLYSVYKNTVISGGRGGDDTCI